MCLATCALRRTRSLARTTLKTIKKPVWALAYNVAAIPLAVASLLNPILAAAAMAASSVFVVSNSCASVLQATEKEPGNERHRDDRFTAIPGQRQTRQALYRIEGQVRGVEKMVEDDRYCIDILTQLLPSTLRSSRWRSRSWTSMSVAARRRSRQATKRTRSEDRELLEAVQRTDALMATAAQRGVVLHVGGLQYASEKAVWSGSQCPARGRRR